MLGVTQYDMMFLRNFKWTMGNTIFPLSLHIRSFLSEKYKLSPLNCVVYPPKKKSPYRLPTVIFQWAHECPLQAVWDETGFQTLDS